MPLRAVGALHVGAGVFDGGSEGDDACWNAQRYGDGSRRSAPVGIAGRKFEHRANGGDRAQAGYS